MAGTKMAATEKVTLLFGLIAYLRKHGATPVSRLAEQFGTTPDIVRHMARFIGTAGVPGDGASYSHQDLYDINWDALEIDDLVEITHVVGVDGTPRFTSMQATALLAGLRALTGVLSPADAEVAQAAASAAEKLRAASTLEGAALTVRETEDPLADRLVCIGEAIHGAKQLSFAYVDLEGEVTARTVDAHRLVQLQDAWYVEGWCHSREAMRTFRVEFMTDLTVRDEAQAHPAPPTTRTQITVERARGITVELLVDSEALYRLKSWKPKRVGKGSRGRTRVAVTLIHESRVIPLVCEAPGAIEVVSPDSTRALVADWAASLVQATSGQDAQGDSPKDSVH